MFKFKPILTSTLYFLKKTQVTIAHCFIALICIFTIAPLHYIFYNNRINSTNVLRKELHTHSKNLKF